LLALPLLAGALRLTAHLGQRADDAYHHHFAQTSQRLVEFAQAQSVLRAFNGDGDGGGTRFLQQAIDAQRHAGTRLIYLSALASVLNAWVVQAIFAALLAAAALWLQSLLGAAPAAGDTLAVIVALLLVVRFVDPLQEVASYGEVLRGARGRSTRRAISSPCSPAGSGRAAAPHGGAVELRDVHFRYAQEQADVLTESTCTVRRAA
jgi:ATP-binding cassette subfamily B protein